MKAPHNAIIAKLAKAELEPLGFRQRGRSRLWLADNQSWLNVIEFTPDRWTKGVSLVNAAHWLWAGTGFLAFHEVITSPQHIAFENSEQFAAAVPALISEAASKARGIQERFSSMHRTAQFLVERARSSPERMMPSWWGYQGGIAAGLCGDFTTAEELLSGITDDRVNGHATALLLQVRDPERFISEVEHRVIQQRRALGLQNPERPLPDHTAYRPQNS